MKRDPLTMPVLSDTMETGQLSRWLKHVGDAVKKGDILAEVESDKAIMEVEAFVDGYLSGPLASTGSDILVGDVIGYIIDSPEPGESTDTAKTPSLAIEAATFNPHTAQAEITKQTTQASSAPSAAATMEVEHVSRLSRAVKISPYARGLAHELDIDPGSIKPDSDGIIRSPQILAAALQGTQPDLHAGPDWHYKLFTPMHRAVADNMIATLDTPTFRISAKLSLSNLLKAAKQQQLSFTLLLAKALALNVQAHPQFNAVYTSLALAQRKQVDVGIAMDTPGSLITPVLRDAAKRALAELAEDWKKLRNKVIQRRIVSEDYQGATIYLSNLGMFKVVTQFDAIVPSGAAAILAIGAAQDGIATVTMSCDHRVVYGADAARFLESFAELLN